MTDRNDLIPLVMKSGPFEGWTTWRNIDPFEDLTGPFFYRETEQGVQSAFVAERRHLNGGGFVHGGCLLTFADFSLFAIASPLLGETLAVTVSLNADFLDRVAEGERIEATGEVTKRARSLLFIRGIATAGGRPILSFTGLVKPVEGLTLHGGPNPTQVQA